MYISLSKSATFRTLTYFHTFSFDSLPYLHSYFLTFISYSLSFKFFNIIFKVNKPFYYAQFHLPYMYSFTTETSECPAISDPDNGKVFIISDGETAIFACNNGFVTIGNSRLQCIDGKWSSSPPKCHPS